jgi:hypothetical protein
METWLPRLAGGQGRWLELASLFFLLGVLVWLHYLYRRVERPEGCPAFAKGWHGWTCVVLAGLALGFYGAGFLQSPALQRIGLTFLTLATALGVALIRRRLPPLGYYLPMMLAGFTFLLT